MQQQVPSIIRATGRRKTSVAVASIKEGSGKITINNRSLDEYFGGNLSQKQSVLSPLVLSGLKDKLDIEVEAKGGGLTGQADAIKLAISRALVIYKPDLRNILKKAGMLRRDPRMVERKKAGKPKARKSFQWTKR
ncbi:MAG: 30S ribosomal protein S9 [Endomicrobiia bacterium]